MLFSNRSLRILLRTPVGRSAPAASSSAPQAIELESFSSSSTPSSSTFRTGPTRPTLGSTRRLSSASYIASSPYSTAGPAARPRAGTRISSLQVIQSSSRGYASDPKKKELYSDEGGSTGAGTDDVAHSDAAFDPKETSPEEAAKGIEKESGKDYTTRSPANKDYSQAKRGSQGDPKSGEPLQTSKSEAGKR